MPIQFLNPIQQMEAGYAQGVPAPVLYYIILYNIILTDGGGGGQVCGFPAPALYHIILYHVMLCYIILY